MFKKAIETLNGGIAVYVRETDRFRFLSCSESVIQFFGFDMEEYRKSIVDDALSIIIGENQQEVRSAIYSARAEGKSITVYLPVMHGTASKNWVQIDGWVESGEYYILFSGCGSESQLFQSIANELTENIYVIEKDSYELLYSNNLDKAYWIKEGDKCSKCYKALFNRDEPCAHCVLKENLVDDELHVVEFEEGGESYRTHFREISWNGRPSHVKYLKNINEEIKIKNYKERIEKYFETVLKNLPGGITVFRYEKDGTVKPEYLSDGFARMLGATMEDVWGYFKVNTTERIHPEDRDRVKQKLRECVLDKTNRCETQYRILRKDNVYIWVNVIFSVIQDEMSFTKVYADYHDITDEKKKRDEEKQKFNTQIFQHYMVSDPNVLILGHSNITQNKVIKVLDYTGIGMLERFGDNREEFFIALGKYIEEESDREEFYKIFLNEPSIELYEKGVRDTSYSCYVKLDQKGCFVQFKISFVQAPESGDIIGILTATDITEPVMSEKVLSNLSSINHDFVADIDIFNDTYKVINGKSKKHAEGGERFSKAIMHDSYHVLMESERRQIESMLNPEYMYRRLSTEGSYSFTYTLKDNAGNLKTKNMIVTEIDLRLGRVCLIRSDVTAMLEQERISKYNLEEALTAAKKANAVKSNFLASMSHDIRTPLNAIVGMTTLALSNTGNLDKTRQYLEKISVSSQHLLSLINDVLDISQIEQSKIHMNLISIDMNEILEEISTIMSAQAAGKGIEFKITKNIRNAGFIGDALRIKQIFINLIGNSFKFTPPGGKVEFIIDELCSCFTDKVSYCFNIRDNGIGMSEEFMEHLFEPFARSKMVYSYEGNGLGLSITHGLVKLMNGEIRVDSRLNEGTSFKVYLEFKLAKREEKRHLNKNYEEVVLKGRHFLLVEDNFINSEIMGELLDMHNAGYSLATNGLLAVEEFERSPAGTYDAIFMDIQMPMLDGYEAARRIRALDRPDAKEIPIIAMTANAFTEDVQAAIDAGMDDHIAKPVDMKLLCSKLYGIFNSKDRRNQ